MYGTKTLAGSTLLLFLLSTLLCRCIDLGTVLDPALELTTRPGEHNEVLPDGVYVQLLFDRAMQGESVQELFQVRDGAGLVAGELKGEAPNTASFQFEPAEAWVPGRRYELILSGLLRDARGTAHQLDHRRAFSYAEPVAQPLAVLGSHPRSGATVPPDVGICVKFSEPVEQEGFERAFSLSPAVDLATVWDESSQELCIEPAEHLTQNTVYTLRLSTDIRSSSGRTLPEATTLVFMVSDHSPRPELTDVWLAMDDPQLGYPFLSFSLDGMRHRDAVVLSWNTPMEAQATESAVRLEPNRALTYSWPTPETLVITPRQVLESDTEYRLHVASSARSRSGLSAALSSEHGFRTGDAHQYITEWSSSYGVVLSEEQLLSGLVLEHEVEEHHNEATVTVSFSLALRSTAEQEQFINSVQFIPLVPGSASRPVLSSVNWISKQRVRLGYHGVEPGSPELRHRYLWSVARGWAGEGYTSDEVRVVMELLR